MQQLANKSTSAFLNHSTLLPGNGASNYVAGGLPWTWCSRDLRCREPSGTLGAPSPKTTDPPPIFYRMVRQTPPSDYCCTMSWSSLSFATYIICPESGQTFKTLHITTNLPGQLELCMHVSAIKMYRDEMEDNIPSRFSLNLPLQSQRMEVIGQC